LADYGPAVTTSEFAEQALDQATAEMLSAVAVVAKMLMQADPANELTDELWEACLRVEETVGKVRSLRGT
jgi:hypothetical protein